MKGSPVSCEEGTLFASGFPADTVLQVFGPGFGQGSTDLISGGMHHAASSIGPDGLSVGVIGMGCEGFLDRPYEQVCEYVDIMEQAGANLIDLYAAPILPSGRIWEELWRGGGIDLFCRLHLCTVWKNGQYQRTRDIREVKESFESQLKALRTDYAEIGMIHYVDSLADWESIRTGPVLEYARQLLREERSIISDCPATIRRRLWLRSTAGTLMF